MTTNIKMTKRFLKWNVYLNALFIGLLIHSTVLANTSPLISTNSIFSTKSTDLQLEDAKKDAELELDSAEYDLRSDTPSGSKVRMSLDEYDWVAHVSANSRSKRFLDIVGSLVGIGLTSLISLPIAILIQIEEWGQPVFFVQERVGLNGKKFRIYKFRSMYVNPTESVENEANSDKIFKNKNDPRVTKVGYWLRKFSLDEFPQFFNVLKGEMSLVGTRPPTVGEFNKYDKVKYLKRLQVKPGITGFWQISGRSNIKEFEKIVELDLEYQKDWNIFRDIKILFKTVIVVVLAEGSY